MSLSAADVALSKSAPASASAKRTVQAQAQAQAQASALVMRDAFGREIGIWRGQVLEIPR